MTPSPTPSLAGEAGEPRALPFAILADELVALRRFHETCEDSQPYDVPKSMMQRLAEIGLVRRVTAAMYEFTTFGLSVINGDFNGAAAIPALPPDTGKQESYPEGFDASCGHSAHAMRTANALMASTIGKREWDVPMVAAALDLFRATSQPACTNSQTALIRDLIGALQEVLPYLDDERSQQERELGADVRNLIRQAQRESQPAPTPDAARQALSDEQVEPLFREVQAMLVNGGTKDDWFWFACGVEMAERAHGIRAASMQDTSSPQSPQGGA